MLIRVGTSRSPIRTSVSTQDTQYGPLALIPARFLMCARRSDPADGNDLAMWERTVRLRRHPPYPRQLYSHSAPLSCRPRSHRNQSTAVAAPSHLLSGNHTDLHRPLPWWALKRALSFHHPAGPRKTRPALCGRRARFSLLCAPPDKRHACGRSVSSRILRLQYRLAETMAAFPLPPPARPYPHQPALIHILPAADGLQLASYDSRRLRCPLCSTRRSTFETSAVKLRHHLPLPPHGQSPPEDSLRWLHRTF